LANCGVLLRSVSRLGTEGCSSPISLRQALAKKASGRAGPKLSACNGGAAAFDDVDGKAPSGVLSRLIDNKTVKPICKEGGKRMRVWRNIVESSKVDCCVTQPLIWLRIIRRCVDLAIPHLSLLIRA